MSSSDPGQAVRNRRWLRWLPAVVVPAVIAAAAVVAPPQAGAAADLPAKTPEQILDLVANSSVRALSGTLEQTSQLGLPELPTEAKSPLAPAASALDLLTGSHTARVYLDGATKVRVQVLDSLGERDAVRNGKDVWLYSSKDNSVTHVTLPAASARKHVPAPGMMHTPAELVHRLLAAIDSSTRVTAGAETEVAGRSAYDLVLTPRATDTLVGSVAIAVDSQTGLPLSVTVQARGQQSPAFRLAFTSLTLQKPDAARFDFVPPAGAKVKEQALPKHSKHPKNHHGTAMIPHTVSGTGWDAVIDVPDSVLPAKFASSPLLSELTRAVPGGRLLSTSLVNILLTNDGHVLIGSVPLDRLQAAAR